MTIPKNITKDHIINAIADIENRMVVIPINRKSRQYSIHYKGKYYPPKFVISQANKHANGEFYDSNLFGGGYESNEFLRKKGFEISDKPST